MKSKHAGWAVAAAAALSLSAFAQTAVTTSSGAVVTSSADVVVTPGVPAVAPGSRVIDGAVMAQADQSTSKSGNTTTVTTTYWVNVPPDVQRDDRFQRWQRLR